jgi:hypothetical protein
MATTHSRHHLDSDHLVTPKIQKNVSQRVFITLGILFLILGLVGLAVPYLGGMHFSTAHNLIHFVLAGLYFWIGYQRESKRTYIFGYVVGSFLVLLGILGFAIGSPAYLTTMPNLPAEQSLWIVMPGILELGMADHFVHLILGAATIMGGVNAKRFLNRIRIAVKK